MESETISTTDLVNLANQTLDEHNGRPPKFLISNSSKWRPLNATKTLPFLLLLQRTRTLEKRLLQIQALLAPSAL